MIFRNANRKNGSTRHASMVMLALIMPVFCPLCNLWSGEQADILFNALTGKCVIFFMESKVPPFLSLFLSDFFLICICFHRFFPVLRKKEHPFTPLFFIRNAFSYKIQNRARSDLQIQNGLSYSQCICQSENTRFPQSV